MTLPRYAAKRDSVESEICDLLEQLGFHVEPISAPGVPDLLLSRAGHWFVAECKSKAGKLTPAQIEFRDRAKAPVPVFRSVDDVLGWVAEVRP